MKTTNDEQNNNKKIKTFFSVRPNKSKSSEQWIIMWIAFSVNEWKEGEKINGLKRQQIAGAWELENSRVAISHSNRSK